MSSENVTLSKDDLKEIVATAVQAAVAESRKPVPPTEKELAEFTQQNELRKQQADLVKKKNANDRAYQMVCSHSHPKREGGQSHGVFVQDDLGGYCLCQECSARLRPANAPRGDHGAIYDTELFNRVFQECADSLMQ